MNLANDVDDKYTIVKEFSNTIQALVNPILGLLQVLGGILLVVSIAIFGLLTVAGVDGGTIIESLGGPKAKIQVREAARLVIIGSALLFSGSTIVKIVMNIFI